MRLTRSYQPCRRGRSAAVAKSYKNPYSRKTVSENCNLFSQLPLLDERRIFSSTRRKKVVQFWARAKRDPKLFGEIATDKWFKSLLKDINEPGVVLLEHVKVWYNKHPELFKKTSKKHRSKSKKLKRLKLKLKNKEEKWSTTAVPSDDDKSSFIASIELDELDDDVFEAPGPLQNPSHSPKPLPVTNVQVEDLSELTLETAKLNDEICDADLMRELFGDDAWQNEPESPSKFGTDITDVDPDLLAEVMAELDFYFNGVDTAKLVEMVGKAENYSTLTNDSGISSTLGSACYEWTPTDSTELLLFA